MPLLCHQISLVHLEIVAQLSCPGEMELFDPLYRIMLRIQGKRLQHMLVQLNAPMIARGGQAWGLYMSSSFAPSPYAISIQKSDR
jgi:hypothetical protein